jgi:hypothetical protein
VLLVADVTPLPTGVGWGSTTLHRVPGKPPKFTSPSVPGPTLPFRKRTLRPAVLAPRQISSTSSDPASLTSQRVPVNCPAVFGARLTVPFSVLPSRKRDPSISPRHCRKT